MRTINQLSLISLGKETNLGPYYEFQGNKLVNIRLTEAEKEVLKIIRTMPYDLPREQAINIMHKVTEIYLNVLAIELTEQPVEDLENGNYSTRKN